MNQNQKDYWNDSGSIKRKKLLNNIRSFLSVRPLGFEPKTYGLENRCSIQLSYGRIVRQKYKNITKTQTNDNILCR